MQNRKREINDQDSRSHTNFKNISGVKPDRVQNVCPSTYVHVYFARITSRDPLFIDYYIQQHTFIVHLLFLLLKSQ